MKLRPTPRVCNIRATSTGVLTERDSRVPVRSAQTFAIALSLASLAAAGCVQPVTGILNPNRRPSVEFTRAPIGADPSDPNFYAYRVFWSGDDPDGRVERYEYCIDPTASDSMWVKTERSEELIFFRATEPDGVPGPVPRSTSFHVLVLRAVDDDGAYSATKHRSFYSYTVAPSVAIRAPIPSGLLQAAIVPSVYVRWDGQDPDGQFHDKPVYYRHKLFSLDDPTNRILLADPDSLRRRDGPGGFAAWDSSGAESTFVRFTNLTPGRQYLFAVVAFDEAGAYSPVFSLFDNMLQMYVTYAATIGPRIHIFNTIIDFTYDSGGYTADPLRWVRIEAGTGSSLNVNWDAISSPGSAIESYRWAVDLRRLDDDTGRTDEVTDVQHWSRPSPLTTSCVFRGLPPGQHFLYIEATDNNGLSSLGVVEILMVAPTFENDLLVVDDTRMEPDKLAKDGTLDFYKSPWPSAAELDTFLYARGGVPWRATQEPAAGVLSPPGVFAGYAFDTLGTRLGLENPINAVKLSRLAQYRHVVWMVDRLAASYPDVMGIFPMPSLRFMSTPGRASSLGAYLGIGGRVWLCGGGAGTVVVDPYNSLRNDDTYGRVYSNSLGELVQGRVMYDAAHWQSAFTATIAHTFVVRAPRADQIAESPWTHDDTWTGGSLTAPDYRRLPTELRYRDPTLDPIPPTRFARQGSLYYRSSITCEYVIEPNDIEEDVDPSGPVISMASVLDTLYEARSILLRRTPAPTMTWYHGHQTNRFVFSGFAPWDFHRDDCIALTDFVLQDLWGLHRDPVSRSLFVSGTSPRPGTRAALRRAGPAVAAPVSRVARGALRR